MKKLRRRANAGQIPAAEYLTHLHFMNRCAEHARKGRILYLKHSGERITELRTLPDEELNEWYSTIRSSNERQQKAERERAEKMRMAQDAQRKRAAQR